MLEMFVVTQNWLTNRRLEIEENGATAVEYALMVGLLALTIIGSVTFFGRRLKGELEYYNSTLPGGPT